MISRLTSNWFFVCALSFALADDSADANNNTTTTAPISLPATTKSPISDTIGNWSDVECLMNETRVDVSFPSPDIINQVWIEISDVSGGYRESTFFEDDSEFYQDVPNSTSYCVPRDECYFVQLYGNFDLNDFTISSNQTDDESGGGVNFLKGPFDSDFILSYPKMFVAEIGNGSTCNFTCTDDEMLLEVEIAGQSKSSLYMFEDDGTALFAKSVWDRHMYHQKSMCLPKTSCTTLVGVNYHGLTDNLNYEYNVTVDGELIENFAQSRAISQDIGSGCNDEGICGEDESLLELFIYRSSLKSHPNMTWSILSNDFDERSGVILPGTRFTYHRECIPKQTCALFTLSVPETVISPSAPNGSSILYWENSNYYILLDGVFYGKNSYDFGSVWEGREREYEIQDILGDECFYFCRSGEDFIDFALSTSPITNKDQRFDAFYSVITARNASDPAGPGERLFTNEQHFAGVPLEYRNLYCLPDFVYNHSCVELLLRPDSSIPFNYTVSVNGDLSITGGSENETRMEIGGVCEIQSESAPDLVENNTQSESAPNLVENDTPTSSHFKTSKNGLVFTIHFVVLVLGLF